MSKKHLLSDTDYTKGKDNRFGNSVIIGRVSQINTDKVATNVRVIMPDKVDHKGKPLVTKPVPVMQVSAGQKRSFAVPRVGQNAVLVKLPNSTSDYMVLGTFYTTSDPPPVDDPKLDYVEYDDGSIKQFNAADGTETWKLKGGIDIATDKAIKVESQEPLSIKVTGDVIIEASGVIHLKGRMKLEGDIEHIGNMTTTGHHTDAAGGHG